MIQHTKVKKFYKHVTNDYPSAFYFFIFFVLLSSLFELLGFAALMPMFDIFLNPGSESNYELINKTFNTLDIPINLNSFYFIVVAIFCAKGFFVFLTLYYKEKIRIQTYMDFRQTIYDAIIRAEWPFFVKQKVGNLNNIVITLTQKAALGIKHLSQFVVSVIFAIVFIVFSLLISWEATIFSILIGGSVFILVNFTFKASHRLGKKTGLNENKVNQVTVNSFTSPKQIKGSCLENYFISRFSKVLDEGRRIELSYAKITSFLTSSLEPLSVLACVLILFVSINLFSNPLEQVMVFVLVIYRLYGKIGALPSAYAGILHHLPLYEMCSQLRDEARSAEEKIGSKTVSALEKQISIKDVDFEYTKDNPILKKINIEIQKGSFVGITGHSGGGKTTLIDLIMGIIVPGKGRLEIDNVDYNSINKHTFRKKISYVSQDSVLYNLTVAENIALGSDKINLKRVIEAAKLAHADDFIRELPEGYNTNVGERGVSLSGGQKQRVIFAQALYRSPEILILDEATSNLDSSSESLIQQSIEDLKGSMTIISIAHRLKTIEKADIIYILENGKIVEYGKPVELLKKNGSLAQLVDDSQVKACN